MHEELTDRDDDTEELSMEWETLDILVEVLA
jgi:hypothetical protein